MNMEIVIELPKDINKLCRTCMNIVEDDQRNCVIDDVTGQKSELNEMLLHIMGTNVLSEECLPKFMCNECLQKLEIAYLFKQQCQNTYLHFRDFMYSPEKSNSEVETTNNFICTTCRGSFSTQYRFKYNSNDDVNTDLISDNAEEISSLVSDRRQQVNAMVNNKHKFVNLDRSVSSKIAQHEEIEASNKSRSCDLCSRTFNTELSLHLHFVNHAVLAESDTDPDIFNQYFFCRSCGETFSCYEDLENHVFGCSEFREFKCTICNQVFNMKQVPQYVCVLLAYIVTVDLATACRKLVCRWSDIFVSVKYIQDLRYD
ncbi:zinc-finger associated domain containing protein [Oryctes borbonicus]|uniref:Zinc-finger associated domain containing protein n=1 Tax=Oryctes borbonicus TaxID=1629725 RepID=A0A0T6B4C0_9SCAR|nr:zinc-finger associated domain containing protein [Oryctes borbonicus]